MQFKVQSTNPHLIFLFSNLYFRWHFRYPNLTNANPKKFQRFKFHLKYTKFILLHTKLIFLKANPKKIQRRKFHLKYGKFINNSTYRTYIFKRSSFIQRLLKVEKRSNRALVGVTFANVARNCSACSPQTQDIN